MRKLLPIIFLICSCSPLSTEWDGYGVSVDESVGCPNILHPTLKDTHMVKGEIIEVTSNYLDVPGMFINTIVSKEHEFVDDSVYTASGMFRKPEGAQNEALDINLQLVQGFTEWHAEVFVGQNPYSDLYQWVWTRQDLNIPIKLFKIEDDNNWHSFKLVAQYQSNPKTRTLKSITVDNKTAEINMEMGTNPKAWESSFFLLLETTNMYTQCNPLFTSIGLSEWDNVTLTKGE